MFSQWYHSTTENCHLIVCAKLRILSLSHVGNNALQVENNADFTLQDLTPSEFPSYLHLYIG